MRQFKVQSSSVTDYSNLSTRLYFRDVNKYDLLTKEQETELIKEIQQGNEHAKNKLILHNLRFVVSVANSFTTPTVDFSDLIQEGNLGMIEAAMEFDYKNATNKFISYAVWHIRKRLFAFMDKNVHSKGVTIPAHIVRNRNRLLNYDTNLMTDEEIEKLYKKLNIKGDDTHKNSIKPFAVEYIDAPHESGDSKEYEGESIDIDTKLEYEYIKNLVSNYIDELEPDEQDLICRRFGFRGHSATNYNVLGEIYGVTHQTVFHKYKRIIRKLKRILKEDGYRNRPLI